MTPGPEEKFRIAVIIVSWNRKNMLKRCLLSLDTHLRFSRYTLVIDNSSSDGTPDMIRSQFPGVVLIENDQNQGYGRAVNQGLAFLKERSVSADYFVLLNNDAYFGDESFGRLLSYLDRTPEVQAAIPAVFGENDALQTGVGGYELTLKSAFAYFFGLSILAPSLFRGFFVHQDHFYRKRRVMELDWISGVCLTMKASVVDRIPLLPEDYFMYAEDTAFCREIRQLGKIVYYPKARLFHTHGRYESKEGPVDSSLWLSSLFKYFRDKTDPKAGGVKLVLLKLVFLGGFCLRWIRSYLLSKERAKRSLPPEKFRQYCLSILKGLLSTKVS